MTVIANKVRGWVDYLMQGFDQKETVFEDMLDDFEDEYEVQDNLALKPAYNYEPKMESRYEHRSNVVNLPSAKGHEVVVIEPRSFEDAAQIAIQLKERKTIVLNLHLLDKEQSQRMIDFICGAAHALNGKPQKVGELVFVFTPNNVTLSVDAAPVSQNKFNDSLWGGALK